MEPSEQNHPSSPSRLPDPPPNEVPRKRAPVEEPSQTPSEVEPLRDPEEPGNVPEKAPTDPDIAQRGPVEAMYWIAARPHERYDSFEAANY